MERWYLENRRILLLTERNEEAKDHDRALLLCLQCVGLNADLLANYPADMQRLEEYFTSNPRHSNAGVALMESNFLTKIPLALKQSISTYIKILTESSNEEKKSLARRIKETLESKETCVVCWESVTDTFFPCGHGTCQNCCKSLENCPLCRSTIYNTFKGTLEDGFNSESLPKYTLLESIIDRLDTLIRYKTGVMDAPSMNEIRAIAEHETEVLVDYVLAANPNDDLSIKSEECKAFVLASIFNFAILECHKNAHSSDDPKKVKNAKDAAWTTAQTSLAERLRKIINSPNRLIRFLSSLDGSGAFPNNRMSTSIHFTRPFIRWILECIEAMKPSMAENEMIKRKGFWLWLFRKFHVQSHRVRYLKNVQALASVMRGDSKRTSYSPIATFDKYYTSSNGTELFKHLLQFPGLLFRNFRCLMETFNEKVTPEQWDEFLPKAVTALSTVQVVSLYHTLNQYESWSEGLITIRTSKATLYNPHRGKKYKSNTKAKVKSSKTKVPVKTGPKPKKVSKIRAFFRSIFRRDKKKKNAASNIDPNLITKSDEISRPNEIANEISKPNEIANEISKSDETSKVNEITWDLPDDTNIIWYKPSDLIEKVKLMLEEEFVKRLSKKMANTCLWVLEDEGTLGNTRVAKGRSHALPSWVPQISSVGDRVAFRKENKIVVFMHWMQSGYDEPVDLDLSAILYDPIDMSYKDNCSFTKRQTTGMKHSGDIINAPPPNGASEYIIITPSEIGNGKLLALTVYSYNRIDFELIPHAFVGIGELRPDSEGPGPGGCHVLSVMPITGKCQNAFLGTVNFDSHEITFAGINFSSLGYQVENTYSQVGNIIKDFENWITTRAPVPFQTVVEMLTWVCPQVRTKRSLFIRSKEEDRKRFQERIKQDISLDKLKIEGDRDGDNSEPHNVICFGIPAQYQANLLPKTGKTEIVSKTDPEIKNVTWISDPLSLFIDE